MYDTYEYEIGACSVNNNAMGYGSVNWMFGSRFRLALCICESVPRKRHHHSAEKQGQRQAFSVVGVDFHTFCPNPPVSFNCFNSTCCFHHTILPYYSPFSFSFSSRPSFHTPFDRAPFSTLHHRLSHQLILPVGAHKTRRVIAPTYA